ncbi:Hypothetical protein D9617_1g081070 [Elsinoe fawcettii]|nr:Hypothetical protein D9617_1g081070 [Elsinoe fawcettii]
MATATTMKKRPAHRSTVLSQIYACVLPLVVAGFLWVTPGLFPADRWHAALGVSGMEWLWGYKVVDEVAIACMHCGHTDAGSLINFTLIQCILFSLRHVAMVVTAWHITGIPYFRLKSFLQER